MNNQPSPDEMIIEDLLDLMQENAEMADNGEPDEDQYLLASRQWYISYLSDQVSDYRSDGVNCADDAWGLWVYYTLLEGVLAMTDEHYSKLLMQTVGHFLAGTTPPSSTNPTN